MKANSEKEQHIAVFGESGSGKTVLVSSFYGVARERNNDSESRMLVRADDQAQGNILYRNFLAMRDDAVLPEATRFKPASYSFTFSHREQRQNNQNKKAEEVALRLVWHDYPGEWFEQGASGETERARQVETFRSLLKSDVAFFLVDGQKILDNPGQTKQYLKSLLSNFINGLDSIRNEVLEDGVKLKQFPRVWIFALSKADLLPEIDVKAFEELLIMNVAEEMKELKDVISSFVQNPDAISLGEDFLRLSSAKFTENKIEVQNRIGLDLVLPLAAILPFEKVVLWSERKKLPGEFVEKYFNTSFFSGILSSGLIAGGIKVATKVPVVGKFAIALSALDTKKIAQQLELAGEKLKQANIAAREKHDYLEDAFTSFLQMLEKGEEMKVLTRGKR